MPPSKIFLFLFIASSLLVPGVRSMAETALPPREKSSMDFGWKFKLGDIDGYSTNMYKGGTIGYGSTPIFNSDFDDSTWRGVHLPHDFVVEGQIEAQTAAVNGSLPHKLAWYRRAFEVSNADSGKRFILSFDGISRFSEVFVNGFHVKTQRFGYVGFSVDITEALHFGETNVIAVRVNSQEGAEGWWYEGGGIYRHVWLEKCSPVHIPPYGVALNPALDDSFTQGTLDVQVELINESNRTEIVAPAVTIKNSKGQVVASGTGDARPVEPGATRILQIQLDIANPKLWSPSEPNLYSVETRLIIDGTVIDGLNHTTGFRRISFELDGGLLINGKKEIIKGVCMHQDHAGVGVAVPDALLKYRLEKLQELGVNAYRSHHPNATELSELCNEMGILVLAETRHFSAFSDSLDMLQRMVRMERNNPCIIAWSLGNEERIQGEMRAVGLVDKMRRSVHQLDIQKRPVTLAFNGATNGPVAQAVDVVGYNYGSQRIRGTITHGKPIYSSESGSIVCTRGEYETDPARGVVSSYDRKAVSWGQSAEEVMDFTMTLPNMAGTFIWTGFDYRGEPTPYEWPNVLSNFGLLDLCGFRKDISYYFEAWWSDKEVLHVMPHWNWEGTEKKEIDVWVFSNHEAVELFLNGKSLGKKKMPKYKHLAWQVDYEPGKLTAKGYRNALPVAETTVQTAGEPALITLTANRTNIDADEQDLVVFNIAIQDANQVLCPNADNLLKFHLSGPGRILGSGNGNPRSHESDKLPMRKAFHGLMQVIVQSTTEPGEIQLTVTGTALKDGTARVRSTVPKETQKRVPSDVTHIDVLKFYPKQSERAPSANADTAWTLEQMYQDTAGYSID